MHHIVYLMKFHTCTFPNLYIGSKSNCIVRDNKMYGNRGLYEGSARDPTFRMLIESGIGYDLFVIGHFQSYKEALQAERLVHMKHDVVANPQYFNRSIAMENTFSNPEYATYRHVSTDKVARLKRTHSSVVAGDWVGVTKGMVLTPEQRKAKGSPGELNYFYGKEVTPEQRAASSERAKLTFRGKPKTHEQRRKMSEARTKYWAARRQNNTDRKPESL